MLNIKAHAQEDNGRVSANKIIIDSCRTMYAHMTIHLTNGCVQSGICVV